METQVINRIAGSGLVTLDLKDFLPAEACAVYDIKDNLFGGFVLKEKEFREFLKGNDWDKYRNTNVAITCSVDAVVPVWAYMLLAAYLEPFASSVVFGDRNDLEKELFRKALAKINLQPYKDAKVVVKGCGDVPIPVSAYVEITRILKPVAQSIMYGEPCSTVPIYKRLKIR